MAIPENHLGQDLRLLENLAEQAGRDRGADLLLREVVHGLQTDTDLQTVSGHDNLRQALLLRFLTPLGELADLGHPAYGSRLYELIGELNSVANRNRARMYTLQALAGEPRVREPQELTVEQGPDRVTVLIRMRLAVIDSDTPLNLVFPFSFEGGTP